MAALGRQQGARAGCRVEQGLRPTSRRLVALQAGATARDGKDRLLGTTAGVADWYRAALGARSLAGSGAAQRCEPRHACRSVAGCWLGGSRPFLRRGEEAAALWQSSQLGPGSRGGSWEAVACGGIFLGPSQGCLRVRLRACEAGSADPVQMLTPGNSRTRVSAPGVALHGALELGCVCWLQPRSLRHCCLGWETRPGPGGSETGSGLSVTADCVPAPSGPRQVVSCCFPQPTGSSLGSWKRYLWRHLRFQPLVTGVRGSPVSACCCLSLPEPSSADSALCCAAGLPVHALFNLPAT